LSAELEALGADKLKGYSKWYTGAAKWGSTKLSLCKRLILSDPLYQISFTSLPFCSERCSTLAHGGLMNRFPAEIAPDRRLARRHNLRTPLRVRVRKADASERCAESENLSQCGVFFATDLMFSKGAAVDLLVEMPEEVTGVPVEQWLCTGHVVRVVPMDSPRGSHGVSVQFDFYEVSRGRQPQWSMGVGLRGPVAPQIHR